MVKTQVKLGKPKPQRKAMAKGADDRFKFAHGAAEYGSDQSYGRDVQKWAMKNARVKARPSLGSSMVGIGATVAKTTRKNAPAGVKVVKALRSRRVGRPGRGDT